MVSIIVGFEMVRKDNMIKSMNKNHPHLLVCIKNYTRFLKSKKKDINNYSCLNILYLYHL